MRLSPVVLAALFLSLLVGAGAEAQDQHFAGALCGVKVDTDVKTAPAGANPGLARFLGVWGDGKWTSGLCNGLIVREVTATGTATVRYVFPPTRDVPQGWFEKTDAGLDSSGRLSFKSLLGADVRYQLQADGALMGWFQPASSANGVTLVETLKRKTPLPVR